jgi:DNA-binding LacI/PurR family transcriptional regulator
MLLGLMRALTEAGVPCPAGMSVVGFDDSAWTEHFSPGLTVIAQPAYEIGKAAFGMLLSRMQAGDSEQKDQPELTLLAAELRVRGSTAPPDASAGDQLTLSTGISIRSQ